MPMMVLLLLGGCATATPTTDGRALPGAVAQTANSDQPGPPKADRAPAKPPAASSPLYDRLGGKDAITAVVDQFLGRVSADERINARFSNADLPRLRGMLIDFVCQATGGPCKYTGKDMKTAHAGMRIAGGEFDALVQSLKGALDHFKVPAREQNELLGALGPMKSDIAPDTAAVGSEPAAGGTGGTAPSKDLVAERAQAVRAALGLLEKANAARLAGNRSFADQLFSSAELTLGTAAVADLAPLFRDGAPPRITTPLRTVPKDAAPQPAAAGNSSEDDPAPKAKRGSLTGTIFLPGQRPFLGLAVVTLEPASRKFAHRPPKHRIIEQRDREFAPKVLAVPVGSTVSFPNFDSIYHNVFSRSRSRPFDLGMYKGGQARDLTFDKEGVVRVGCNLHANMSAYVVAVSAPHYAVTEPGGKFTFKNLRPGKYRVRAWAENSDTPTVQEIQIKREPATLALTLQSEGAAGSTGPQSDKFGASRGDAISSK